MTASGICKYFSLILFIILVSGCGPQFRTDYIFTPPKAQSGKTCLFQCETIKQQCLQLEELNRQRCEDYSRQQQSDCEYNIRATKDREPKWYECGSDSCSADTERCDDSYRSCYQSCGGKIDTVTRCVSNCDQLPPQQK